MQNIHDIWRVWSQNPHSSIVLKDYYIPFIPHTPLSFLFQHMLTFSTPLIKKVIIIFVTLLQNKHRFGKIPVFDCLSNFTSDFFSHSEAVAQRCCLKKVLLEISQNLQESSCARDSFLIKLQASATSVKKCLWHWWFPVNFAKFLRTPFFTEHLRWLLLFIDGDFLNNRRD